MVTAPRTNLSVSQIPLSSRVSKASYTSTRDTGAFARCLYRTSAMESARPATRPQARIALPVGVLLLRLVASTRRFLGMVTSHLPFYSDLIRTGALRSTPLAWSLLAQCALSQPEQGQDCGKTSPRRIPRLASAAGNRANEGPISPSRQVDDDGVGSALAHVVIA